LPWGIQVISTSSPNPADIAQGINYFFALLPDKPAQSAIAAVAERFCKSHRVSGIRIAAEDLLLNLCPLGQPAQLAGSLEDNLRAAAQEVHAKAFNVTLDSVMRFSVRDGHFPFVASADAASGTALLDLRKAIADAQSHRRLRVSGISSYLPHVTMLHGHAIEPIQESIAPISWQVREFVLIRSFFGQSKYEVMGRWPLHAGDSHAAASMLDEDWSLPEGDEPLVDDDAWPV